MPRLLTRRPRPAALLAAGLAVATLGLASVTHTYSGQNAGLTIGMPGCSVGIEWRGDPGIFGSCTGADPDAAPRSSRNAGPQRDASAPRR
ncbi:hypothetical protein [Streptomyces sp. NPDC059850]|uniref:hypothetical protein n=1 Tax=Streptomyces sp. NPDC059850 TaxID=3346970 RepID=UPI00366586EB